MRSNGPFRSAGTVWALLVCALVFCGNVLRADDKKKEAPPPRPAPHAAPARQAPAAPPPASRPMARPATPAQSWPSRNSVAPVNRPAPTPSTRPYGYPPPSAPNRYPAANPRQAPVAGPTRNGGQITTTSNGRAEYHGRDNSRAVFGRDGGVR